MPNTRRTKFRRWVFKHIPPWLADRDFEVFAAVLAFLAGLPLLFGQPTAGSVEEFMPALYVKVWASVLVIAPFFVLAGIRQTPRKTWPRKILWIRVEALGLTALAYASYIYIIAILSAVGLRGYSACMLLLVFGITCHTREIFLQLTIADFKSTLGVKPNGRGRS